MKRTYTNPSPKPIEGNYLERIAKIRRNVLSVLQYSNVVPFTWTTKGFNCFYCSKPIKDCTFLKEHTSNHDAIDLEAFVAKKIISKHVPVKVDIDNIVCKLCPELPMKFEAFISHLELHDVEYYNDVGVCIFPFQLSKDIMQCVLCEDAYDNFTSMLGHMHKVHIPHSFICQICGRSFISNIRLTRHIRYSHVGYRCTVCSKMFPAAYQLERHKQTFHGHSKLYGCDLCSKTFKSAYQRRSHLGKVHSVEKYVIKCEHCPKVCSTKGALILHIQSRHSDLKYECDICNYKAGIKWLITLHKRKHDGTREYECSVCEKLFRRASNLRAHMKVHSGNTGRVCRFCRKGFLDLEQLNSHVFEKHDAHEIPKDVPKERGMLEVVNKLA